MRKEIVLLPVLLLSILSCKKDKTPFADLFVAFNYTGAKIDTTTTASDQLIFRNIDGSPAVYVPATATDPCHDKIFIGTYPLTDTLTWHLRLVDPDGDPATFKLIMNEEHQPEIITTTLNFILPQAYSFNVSTKLCEDDLIVVIGN